MELPPEQAQQEEEAQEAFQTYLSPPNPPTPPTPPEPNMSDFTPEALAAAMTQALRTQTQFKGKIDVPAPAPFEGHSDDAQAFIDRVLNYFDATGNSDAADQSKIAFAFSLMKGSAQNFRDLYYQKASDARKKGTRVYNSWKEFEKDLFKEFPVVDNKTRWLMMLYRLKQGTRSVPVFISTFQTLAMRAGLKDAQVDEAGNIVNSNNLDQLRALFLQGLNQRIVEKLMNQSELPTTMEGWYERVRRLDAYSNFGAMGQVPHRQEHSHSNPYGRVDEPMDVDRVSISPEVREERYRKGLCLLCGKKGHFARNHRQNSTQEGSGRPNQGRFGQGRPSQGRPRQTTARVVEESEEPSKVETEKPDKFAQFRALRLQMSDAEWDKALLDFM